MSSSQPAAQAVPSSHENLAGLDSQFRTSATHSTPPSASRTVAFMLGIVLLGAVAAVASVYFRRTQTEKTEKFWGVDRITAFQLAPMVKLEVHDGKEPAVVDLSGMPGLGHFRHALLEQRHYEWDTVSTDTVATRAQTLEAGDGSGTTNDADATGPLLAELTFWDPRKPEELPPEMPAIQPTTILIELNGGWVGPAESEGSVRLNQRSRPAVKHFLTTMRNVKQARYDDRRNE